MTGSKAVVGSARLLGVIAVQIVNADDYGPVPKSFHAATLNYQLLPTGKIDGSMFMYEVSMFVDSASVTQLLFPLS